MTLSRYAEPPSERPVAGGPPSDGFADVPVPPLAFVAWRERRIDNLTSLLDAISARVRVRREGEREDAVRVGDLLAVVGRRAYGPLLLALGVLAISPVSLIPGSTWLFAFAVLLLSGQMVVGRARPWLPRRVLELRVPEGIIRNAVGSLRPWGVRVDRLLKPRLTFLAQPPFSNVVALLCALAALLTFPLGFIPFGPFAPSLAIVLFGLGVTAKDGLLLASGAIPVVGALWLAAGLFG